MVALAPASHRHLRVSGGNPFVKKALVTGAGGFIGHHLVTYLKKQGYWVRGVDVKYPEYSTTDADEFAQLDLRHWEHAQRVTQDIDEAYLLAADMGGMGSSRCITRRFY